MTAACAPVCAVNWSTTTGSGCGTLWPETWNMPASAWPRVSNAPDSASGPFEPKPDTLIRFDSSNRRVHPGVSIACDFSVRAPFASFRVAADVRDREDIYAGVTEDRRRTWTGLPYADLDDGAAVERTGGQPQGSRVVGHQRTPGTLR